MLGAMLSDAGFRCCVCTATHRHLNGNQPSTDCFYALVRLAGGDAPEPRRRRRSYSPGGPATKSWSPQPLSTLLWPEQFPDSRTLQLAEFKHALAADTKEAGLEFLKGVMEEWAQRNWREEHETWLVPMVPTNVEISTGYRGLTLTRGGKDAGLNNTKTATMLMKDASVGRLLSILADSSDCVAFEWLDVTKPAKLLLNIKGTVAKEDPTGLYLFTQENRLQFIPKMVKTIQEAEAALAQGLLTKLSGTL